MKCMVRDTKIPSRAISVYSEILSDIENLKLANISTDEQLEKAKNIIIQALCKARIENTKDDKDSISQDYIVKVRIVLQNYRNIDQIANYVNNAIEKSKN